MKATEIALSNQTTANAARAVLPSKLGKLIFFQRITIVVLFSSLLVVAFYAHAAQNRAAHWKAEAARLQAQLLQTALPQTEQKETAWLQNAEAEAADATQRPDWSAEPPLRPGMTRADVERVLMHDGGPFAIGEERYLLGKEPIIYPVASAANSAARRKVVKVIIHYLPNNLAGMVSRSFLELRPDDVIASISEPHLE